MRNKPTYEALEKKIKELEQKNAELMAGCAINSKKEPAVEFEPKKIPEKEPKSLDLNSMVNIEEIQSIMDEFHHLTHMVTAVLDIKGNVIESTGWQDICLNFHRKHPQTAKNCTQSDLYLSDKLKPGEYADYKCKNGLWDVVTPLYVGTEHLANIYTGQFFYDDDEIDENTFINQAKKYGFDKDAYMEAFQRIPRYSRETIQHLMKFLVKFTTYVSRIGLLNIELTNEVSERKKLESELEKRIHQRTAQLEETNKELETFTYSVSHDLKAPLRGIDGYSRLLVEEYADKLDDEGLFFLNNVWQSAKQMNQLIEDLLAYSRMERKELYHATIDLKSLIQNLLDQRSHDIEQCQIKITIDLPFETIKSDTETLRQVLTNYLDNAIKYAKKGFPNAVAIGGRQDKAYWTLWVKDSGVGFDPKYIDRIFEIFQRLHRTEEYPGTGVGLAIVRKAAARIGGRVRANSAPGKGSTFYLDIPKKETQRHRRIRNESK